MTDVQFQNIRSSYLACVAEPLRLEWPCKNMPLTSKAQRGGNPMMQWNYTLTDKPASSGPMTPFQPLEVLGLQSLHLMRRFFCNTSGLLQKETQEQPKVHKTREGCAHFWGLFGGSRGKFWTNLRQNSGKLFPNHEMP